MSKSMEIRSLEADELDTVSGGAVPPTSPSVQHINSPNQLTPMWASYVTFVESCVLDKCHSNRMLPESIYHLI